MRLSAEMSSIRCPAARAGSSMMRSPRSAIRHAHRGLSRLVGHRNTTVTETVYRKQLRPMLLEGAVAMDELFGPISGDHRTES
ncbi:Integrase [[Actinomadura] parvosata subsp. kistnae]|uniref:Integrase n=1 Tax=[Actinomadura] parvosata subsp. kistnae TaxID=1909395 RepID=A0A1V0AEF8_9ACTN|nr:hypothetical protein BKM31_50440 [Nonomuraea sp. ATCC 55076]SPL92914.1 Integrase [Actinomadura parvosata subsp. kistnae]